MRCHGLTKSSRLNHIHWKEGKRASVFQCSRSATSFVHGCWFCSTHAATQEIHQKLMLPVPMSHYTPTE